MIKVIFRNVALMNLKNNSYGYMEDIFEDQKIADKWIAKMRQDPDFTNIEPEIIDLSLDVNYMNKFIQGKRRDEYPDISEVIEALLEEAEDRPEKLINILMKRQEVKEKYPLIEADGTKDEMVKPNE